MENSYEICDCCGSFKVSFDESGGFYKCNNCGWCWAYPEDSPDYCEMEDEIKYSYYGIDMTPDEPV